MENLGVLHKDDREIGVRESLGLSAGYISAALALVLVFIGSKICLVGIFGKLPAVVSLSVTSGLIAGGVPLSLWKARNEAAVAPLP